MGDSDPLARLTTLELKDDNNNRANRASSKDLGLLTKVRLNNGLVREYNDLEQEI